MNKDTKFKLKVISLCLVFITLVVAIAFPNCIDGLGRFVKGMIKNDAASEAVCNNTELGLLQENIAINKDKLKEAINNKDKKLCQKTLKTIINKIDKSNDDIKDELKKAEKIADKADSKIAKENLIEVKRNYKKLVSKKSEIKKAIKDDNLGKYAELLSDKTLFGTESESSVPLGEELPNTYSVIEPEEKDISQVSASVINEYPQDKMDSSDTGYLEETIDTEISDSIKAKADEIGNNPLKLYSYVRNTITYQPYYGSRKGAKGTLAEYAGNDYDQSSLLIAMLRYKKIPARYVKGTVRLTADEAIKWTGAENIEAAAKILASCGNKTTAITSGGSIVKVQVEHIWVEAYCKTNEYRGTGEDTGDKEWIPFDPSFKETEKVEGMDMSKYINYSKDDFTELSSYVNDYDDTTDYIVSTINNNIKTNVNNNISDFKDKTTSDIFGGYKIVEENLEILPNSIPNTLVSIDSKFSKIDDNNRDCVTFSLTDSYGNYGDLYYKKAAVSLYGKKLTISYVPASETDENIIDKYGNIYSTPAYLISVKPQIKADGKVIAEGSAIGFGKVQSFRFTINRSGNETDNYINELTAGGYYSVGLDYGAISIDELQEIKSRVNNAQKNIDKYGYYSDEVMGEMLNATLKNYMSEVDGNNYFFDNSYGVSNTRLLSFGMTGTQVSKSTLFGQIVDVKVSSLYIDIDGDVSASVSRNNGNIEEYLSESGTKGSALEGTIFEDLFNSKAISTIKILSESKKNDTPIYEIDKSNANEYLSKLNVSSYVKSEVTSAVNSGKTVTIPAENIKYHDWNGIGYIVKDTDTGSAAYMISGGLSGGSMADKIDSDNVAKVFWDSFWNGFKEGFKTGLACGILLAGANILLSAFLPGYVELIFAVITIAFECILIAAILEAESEMLEYIDLCNTGDITAQECAENIAEIFGDLAGQVVGGMLGGALGVGIVNIGSTIALKFKAKTSAAVKRKLDKWAKNNNPVNEDMYYKNKKVFDNSEYYNQETGDKVWPGTKNPKTGRTDPNTDGFLNGNYIDTTLKKGEVIDRYGGNNGTFFGEEGTPIPKRAMAPDSDFSNYNIYKVTYEIPVQKGEIAPWFDQPGGGIQYKLDPNFVTKIRSQLMDGEQLIDGLIRMGYLERLTGGN